MTSQLKIPQPYLLFLGDCTEEGYAKTALGLRDWVPHLCVGEFSLPSATVTTGLPSLNPNEARERGARSLVIGVAPRGGKLVDPWIPALVEALESGLNVVSGMHERLNDVPVLKATAARRGLQLIDVRCPPAAIPIATGRRRSGRRLLTIGTDCTLGKKYTALAITEALRKRGIDADFRATGQTGIMISGSGIPIDAVIADFVAGAAEILTPDAEESHWDIVEGQGSIFHPSYAGVSLGLLHGTQPDVLVLCHDAVRTHIYGLPDFPLPELEEAIKIHLLLARRVNPAVRLGGISLNTSKLSESRANEVIEVIQARLAMPVADIMRASPHFEALVANCLN